MRHDVLMAMSDAELDTYAAQIGVRVKGKRSREAKVAAIEEARQRTAEVEVLGETFVVPIRAFHDKRLVERIDHGFSSDSELEEALLRVLGEEQATRLLELATEDDGSVDIDLWAVAVNEILNSQLLKNFASSRPSRKASSAS